jgi:restriction endonuclease S subunit
MNWPTVPLNEIAPAQASNLRFEPDSLVWHLTLDQIESQTGYIVNKKSARATEAGTSTYVFDNGNVLYSKLRPYLNKVLCPDEPGIATTELVPLRPRADLLDLHYLTYYLRSNHFLNFANVAVAGVKMPRIIMAKFWDHQIPLPSLTEQRRIVEILEHADELRKERAEADAKAARILPALFYKMFGDPATNPKGLVKKKLGDLIRVRSGNFLPAKNMDTTGHYPVYGGNGINGYHSEFMFEEPVIVLGRVGIYCGAVHYSEPNCWVTDNALYVAEQSKDLNPRYLAEALRVANLNQYAGRAGQPLISGNRIYPIDLHRAFTGDLTTKWRKAHMKELSAEMEQQAKALECPATKVNRRRKWGTEERKMKNDFRKFRPAYLRIQEDIERLTRMVKPSYLSVYEQMERALEPIRRRHLEMTRSIELSELASSRLTEIVQANQRWQDLIVQATTSTRAIEDFGRTHQTWLDKINPMQDSIAQLQAAAKMSLGDVAYRMTVTERIFAGIDFEAMRRAVALPESAFLKLENVIGDVTLTYEKLAASIRTIPDVTHLPMFILPGATREVFMTGYALDAIYIPDEPDRERDASEVQLITEVEQETSGCIGLLQAVDPALARPYIGAHDALRGRNADRTRHILSSLRELWNHLLRRLAPDERVWPWVDSQGSRERLCKKGELLFVKDGKENLTRGSRVLFVCRNLNHPPLTDFVVQDTHALVKLVEVFNRVHELESELTDEQLRALLLRTDSWLTYILQIWEGTR